MRRGSNGAPPNYKAGFLSKKSREGIIKNWKRRYFVVDNGLLCYFEKKLEVPPFGVNKKGECSLKGATACIATSDKFADGNAAEKAKRIVITTSDASSDKSMLIEAMDEEEADEWIQSIQAHIEYANLSLPSSPNADRMTESERAMSISSIHSNEGSDSTKSTSTAGKMVTPTPGFILKTRRSDGSKVFVNICSHAEVPTANAFKGSARWPFMLASTCRSFGDQSSLAFVYDIVVNSSVLKECEDSQDETHQLRDMVCGKALRRLAKQFNEELDKNYTIPKSNKGYKGDCPIPSIVLTSEDVTSAKRSSVMKGLIGVTKANIALKKTVEKPDPLVTGGDALAKALPTATSVDSPTRKQPPQLGKEYSGISPAVQADSTSPPPIATVTSRVHLVRKTIPCVVTLKQGVNEKLDPSNFTPGKTHARGVTLVEGDVVQVIGRRTICAVLDRKPTELLLLRTTNGWIHEFTGGGLKKSLVRTVVPQCDDKIHDIRIKTHSFVKPASSGSWFGSNDKSFELMLHIELQLPRNATIMLTRSLSDVVAVKNAIMATASGKKLAFVTFPGAYCDLNGMDEMVSDVQALLLFLDQIQEWLAHILKKSEFYRVKEVKQFIVPTEADISDMMNALGAMDGLNGGYPDEMLYKDMYNE